MGWTKKLGARRMPYVVLKYISNPEIKVCTWYFFIRSSIEDLIDKMRSSVELK